MGDLLIAAAIDLGGGNWFAPNRDRLVAGFKLGKAGDIAVDEAPGALFVRRAYGRPPYDCQPRTRPLPTAYGEGCGHVLFAGQLMDRAEFAAAHGIDPALGNAAFYGAAFERLGERCDALLAGNYAVIQWFPRARHLRLARSPVGYQPLHFWQDGDRIVAATIPRMIHAAAGLPRVLDRDHLADALLLNWREDRRSWFKGIERVPAGSVLTVDRAGRSARRYWSVDAVKPVRFERDADYVEAVEEQFRRAVRASLDGLSKPALSLSGGLDSQAVGSFLLDALPEDARLPCWTAIPHRDFAPSDESATFADEGAGARAFAAMHPRVDAHFVTGFEATFGERLDAVFLLGDCPTQNEANLHWWHAIAEQAAGAGCDALFGGDAGNATFSYAGWTGYPTWFRQGKWLRLAREVHAQPDARGFWRRLVSRAVMPNLPLAWRIALGRSPERWHPSPYATWSPIRAEYAEAGAARRARDLAHDVTFHSLRSARKEKAAMFAAMANEGPEIGIGLTLLHGIPERDPTAYRPLLELTLGMPDEQYLRDGTTRWLARRLLEGRIPDAVRLERRRGAQAADWPLRFRRDRPAMLAQLAALSRDPEIAEIIDFERLTRRLAEWDGGDMMEEPVPHALQMSVSRGLANARFMRFAEGRNLG